jgi:FtsP/CotA-like multicopper oxidase with cupredoxin domain
MPKSTCLSFIAVLLVASTVALKAESGSDAVCPRPQAGSVVPEPEDLRSVNGVLQAELTAYNATQPDGTVRYCYRDGDGHEAPNLRVSPGDLVVLRLKNALADVGGGASVQMSQHGAMTGRRDETGLGDPCQSGAMTPVSTNLHFHGLTIPPVCHQDDVMKTSVQPGDAAFEYRFRIPADEPPGLYWYHPHIHGFSKQQLLGGASGALIVEGIERANKALAGLPERVFVIRDQDLINPNASPAKSEPVLPKNLSINYVPVPFPDYTPATIEMRPGERQLWRVLNASAITYLNLAVLFHHEAQPLGLVALDGVPRKAEPGETESMDWQTHLGVPPGARVEFIVNGPAADETGLLVTRTVDTGPGGENDPNRMLARIVPAAAAPEPRARLQRAPEALPSTGTEWLGDVQPVRVRRLYFSEKLADPNDPTSAVEFYLTVDGQEAKMFDMSAGTPNIVAQQGTVEDWIIENRSSELHDFHIHQLHFLLLEYEGRQLQENYLRDTVNVPYFNGHGLAYPSVRLRMDFRDPNTVGTFVYHCHILEHEDKGMMGSIRVDAAPPAIPGASKGK